MPSVSVRLSECERDAVETLQRDTSSLVEVQRCRILLFLARDLSVDTVQKRIGCARATVYRTVYRFEDSGVDGLRDARRIGTPRKATQEVRDQLLEYVDNSPKDYGWQRSTWTRELLALQLEADCNVRISEGHLGQVLREEKVRRGKPRPALRIPVKHRAKRIKEIQKVVDSASVEEEVFYVDEADVDLNPRIGITYIKRGSQPLILTPGKNVKYYIAGALNTRTGRVLYTHGPRKNSDLFTSLLEALNAAYRRPKRIHIILDNYIIHKSHQTNRKLETYDGRIVLHFLPPYSPEHNPIERLWKQMHDNVTRNHKHKTMPELWKDVTRFLHDVQPFPGTRVSTNRAVA